LWLRFARHVDEQPQVLLADVLLQETAQRSAGAVEGLVDANLVGDERLHADIVDVRERRPHDEGGEEQSQRDDDRVRRRGRGAVRSSDRTTTMRVNEVIITRIDGASDSTVSRAIS
jgi:hypothetical protein